MQEDVDIIFFLASWSNIMEPSEVKKSSANIAVQLDAQEQQGLNGL